MKSPDSSHIAQLFISLVRETLPETCHYENIKLHTGLEKSYSALWLHAGQLQINGESLACGTGKIITATDSISKRGNNASIILRFVVSSQPLTDHHAEANTGILYETIYSRCIEIASSHVLLRLDQVDFPPGAIAHKHTHPGPGIRYLVDGELTLLSDHEKQIVASGSAWFEDAGSPVTATAIDSMPSRFIRTMLLPVEFEGRSTFTLHSEADAHKPRLQTNIRHDELLVCIADIQ